MENMRIWAPLLILAAAPLAAEVITPLATLIKNKKTYDKKWLCVADKTSTLFTKVSHNAHPYFTVWLGDGDNRIKVFAYGKPPFVEGDRIEACGMFTQEKHHGSRIFFDEISAQVILRDKAIGADQVILSSTGYKSLPARP
jgi:hypothetical protein